MKAREREGVGLGLLAGSAALSFCFAGIICWVSVVHVPVFLSWGADQLWEHFQQITDRPVIRSYLHLESNLTLDVFIDKHLNPRVPVAMSSPIGCDHTRRAGLRRLLDSVDVARNRLVATRIEELHSKSTASGSHLLLSMESFETTFSDFRHRSANPKTLGSYEAEFAWNVELGLEQEQTFLKNVLYDCPPSMLLPHQARSVLDAFDSPSGISLTTSLRGQGPHFMQSAGFVNAVVEGIQHWVLVKSDKVPPCGIHPNESVATWLAKSYPLVSTDYSPLEVVLNQGDVLFVPEGYFYGYETTSNISTSLLKFRVEDIGEAWQMLQEARKRMDRHEWKSAEKLLKKAMTLDGGVNHVVLEELGLVYESLLDYDSANDHYRRAIFKNKRSALAFERLASLQIRQQAYPSAKATIEQAAKQQALTPRLLKMNETVAFLLL